MSREPKQKETLENKSGIIVAPLEEIFGDRFGRYSKYIIQERALPDARDGLKPVQRRILFCMNEEGNTHKNKYRKSAKSVGLIMGNYHPHGDISIYDAMVRMSQEWKSSHPLIDMQGNNGSIDDDPAAAMRYTEARLSSISQMLLQDIDKDTVEFAPNFDDTEKEPTVLPARYPNLLINGISGIAAGYATNIPTHNLGEVIDATIYCIQNGHCTLDELMEYIQGPDFPTGAIVQGLQGIKDAFSTGKGRVIVRAKAVIEPTKTIQKIVISEIPYDVIKCNLVRKMDEIRINKDIDGIIDVRDESDRNGLRIVVDVKKDADANLILNYFYKHTDLQTSFNYNMVAIVNKRPIQLGLAQALDAFIAHRDEVIMRRSKYDLEKKEARCHILEGLIKAISVLDEVIAIIRASKDKGDAKRGLIEAFQFSEAQAEAIVTLRLYRLSNTDVTQLKEEFAQLLNEMEELRDIIDNPRSLRRLMINELKEVKKEFATPRKSKIENEIEEIKIDKVQMISNDRYVVTVSKDGYAKRVSLRSYGASENTFTGCKESDHIIGYHECNNLDTLIFFTNKGTYGYVSVYELEEHKWKDIGTHLNTKIKMKGDEKLVNAFILPNFKQDGYFVFTSKHGMIKKTAIVDFEVTRNNKTMTCMNVHKEDELVSAALAYANDDVYIATYNGYGAHYKLDQVPASAPKSKGVKAMNLNDDMIVGGQIADANARYVLLVTTNGAVKRIKVDEIALMNRPVKGLLLHKQVKSNPNYIRYIRVLDASATLTFVDEDVQTIESTDISIMNRESSFSNSITLQPNFYLMKGLEEVSDHPYSGVDEDKEFEELTLKV